MAPRLLVVKADGSVSVHADDKAYKPLNWMSAPCTLTVREAPEDLDATTADLDASLHEVWEVRNTSGDTLQIAIAEILHDSNHDLGIDPGRRRTASRSISKRCSPRTRPRSARAGRSYNASTTRPSDRSTCSAATPMATTWRSR
jgi:hypothetical protein